MFGIGLNCSNRFLGTKVIMVYLEVITWFVEWTCSVLYFKGDCHHSHLHNMATTKGNAHLGQLQRNSPKTQRRNTPKTMTIKSLKCTCQSAELMLRKVVSPLLGYYMPTNDAYLASPPSWTLLSAAGQVQPWSQSPSAYALIAIFWAEDSTVETHTVNFSSVICEKSYSLAILCRSFEGGRRQVTRWRGDVQEHLEAVWKNGQRPNQDQMCPNTGIMFNSPTRADAHCASSVNWTVQDRVHVVVVEKQIWWSVGRFAAVLGV